MQYTLNGFTKGFHTGIETPPTRSLICKNNYSAISQPDVVNDLLSKEVEKGYVIGPFDKPTFPTYRINPITIAESKYSKKKRLVVDLSAPHTNKGEEDSINNLIDKERFSLSYVKIDDAINLIKEKGRGAWLCKTDVTDAFKLVPMHPDLWKWYGISWNGKFYFFTKLVFGSRSSPKNFDGLSQCVCWIAKNNYGIENILHLLDDFLTVDGPSHEGHRTMALLSLIFNKLHIPIAPHKTVGPVTKLEYLGIILDSDKMEVRLPQEKILRILCLLNTFRSRKKCTQRDLLSLLGHLNFATRVILPGRPFIAYLLTLAYSVKRLTHKVNLTQDCRAELNMWSAFLLEWNGVSVFHEYRLTSSPDYELYTDASSSKGYGGYFKGHWFSAIWSPEILSSLDSEESMSMAFMELYPIVVAGYLWGDLWQEKRILFHCDNQAVVSILKKGRSKAKCVNRLMRALTMCAARNNFVFYSRYVPGLNNDIADSLSRQQWTRFRTLAPHADSLPQSLPLYHQLMMDW